MAPSDPRTVLEWFEALSVHADDVGLRERAASRMSSSPYPPLAELTLKAAMLGGPGGWFMKAEHWSRSAHFLRGEPATSMPLRDGWTAWSYGSPLVHPVTVDAHHGWPGELSAVLGPPERGHDDFLPYQAWFLRDAEGRGVFAHQYLDIEGREADGRWTRLMAEPGVDWLRLAELLAVDQPEHWKPTAVPELGRGFVVQRMDDNGNVFEVSRHLTRSAAQLCADRFEARGHKQTYWVE